MTKKPDADISPIRRRLLQGGVAALAASAPLSFATVANALSPRRWTLFETARDNGHRLEQMPGPTLAAAGGVTVLSFDPRARAQQIVGFGGALTESAAHVLEQLPKRKRLAVLRSYYDPVEGIGYTLARTHIGSCDFSLASWTLDDTPDDRTLKHFSLKPMRERQLPLIHEVRKLTGADRFKLVASPWSPPAWMKTNAQLAHGGSLRSDCAAAWAACYVRFVKAMREDGIPVWALTVQNEPDAAQPWESCLYTPWQERDFIAGSLGPALEEAKLSDVKLFGWDHNRDGIEARARMLLGDRRSARYLAGLALHWYGEEDFAASRRVLREFPNAQILMTEGCVEGGAHADAWEPAERYARNIIGDLSNGVCAFIDWNIALDPQGGPNHVGNFCHAPVLVDVQTAQVHYQPSYYYIAHFAKFVRPGATRLEAGASSDVLQSIAFSNPDGDIAAIVVNPTAESQQFTLALGDDARACTIPARAIQTYLAST
jgi:glucosylceramidase